MTSAASNFMDFIAWLHLRSARYFIAWGYELLPEQPSGGDVDIYVHPSYYSLVAKELTRRGYSSVDCPANHDHAHFSRVGNHSIDLFSSFCFAFEGKTMVFSVADPELFLHSVIRTQQFCIASPIIETLFNALRVIGGRQDCMKRIRKHLRR